MTGRSVAERFRTDSIGTDFPGDCPATEPLPSEVRSFTARKLVLRSGPERLHRLHPGILSQRRIAHHAPPRDAKQPIITNMVSSSISNGSANGHKKPYLEKHRLRNGMEAGKPMFGCFSSLPSSWTARIVASCGWDVS